MAVPNGTVRGPYKGSAQNGGRKVVRVKKGGKWVTQNAARAQKEKSLGRSLPKNQEVDHKDGNKNNNSSKNLGVISKSKNVAKENKSRARKK